MIKVCLKYFIDDKAYISFDKRCFYENNNLIYKFRKNLFYNTKDVRNIIGENHFNFFVEKAIQQNGNYLDFLEIVVSVPEEQIFYGKLKYPESYENMKYGECF